MYEFWFLLSASLVFAVLFFLVQPLLKRTANTVTNLCFPCPAKPAPDQADDPVRPFELVVQELQAARHAREAENCLLAA